MNVTIHSRRAAAILAFSLLLSPALAAAPEEIYSEPAAPPQGGAPIVDYALDTEMVVKDWVLCVSQTVAEQLVHAREEGPDRARVTYAELNAAKSCGQFSELRVILRERLYASSADSGHDARVFGALVDFAGSWASAYVVYGGLPEQ
ncbi:MAG TPA: hypothetical protein VFK86_19410 [Bauldia sp.]|nr:hypothetical protein [Bauldia sp.]